jgi:GNAT superfamily N-acetyltransferase
MAIVIRRLAEHDEVENFDCGDQPLNNYLQRYAWTNQEKISIGVSYVAVDEDAPRTVLGYFTLAMASVPRDTFPKKYVRGLPPYDLPLILLARLAVDHRFSGRGLGHALIGIGSTGIHDMVLYPSRVQRRAGHKGCFSTCGRSARPYGAEAAEPAFHRGLALPSKNPPLANQSKRDRVLLAFFIP